jgi:acetyl-CoA acetyltransferase
MGRLTDKYCIVGVGETAYTKNSGKTTRAMGAEAVRNAINDAGLTPADVNGMMSYQMGDSTPSPEIAADLGIRLDFFTDAAGGGSSSETLVGLAIGAIEAGMCETVAIFRSMNGYSEFRIGGTGRRAAAPVRGLQLVERPYGMVSAGQRFAPVFMRHMMEYGTTSEQVAAVKVAHSKHASNNPKAIYKKRYSVDDVLNSRWVCKPLHLLDCCVETDNATAIIVTSAERARNMRRQPIYIMGAVGRITKKRGDTFYNDAPITDAAGRYAEIAMNLGWANPATGSAMILRR